MSVSVDFEGFRENNRLEAKSAAKGLPLSIWETYSAFANTEGGLILLGVVENEDNSLRVVGLQSPEKLIKEFWDTVNNPKKVNVNLLSSGDVFSREYEGKEVVVINVPRADRPYRPVYINGNPLTGTYRRNGEGDYHCSVEEYQAMVRDASYKTQDLLILDDMGFDVFNAESIRGYRQMMSIKRPGHVWEKLDDEDFLLRIGAVGIGSDGKRYPTVAGVLMFGDEFNIVRELPNFFLDYRENFDFSIRWTDRIVSSSGEWSGNLFDFYFKVYNKLIQNLKVPFSLNGGFRVDDTSIHKGVREVLVNCLVNADYYGRGGVVVLNAPDEIRVSNPGRFRIEVEAAKVGGISDPRNSTIMKMFSLIDIGERAGSGIPSIFAVWKDEGFEPPTIIEKFNPDRIEIVLSLKKTAIKNGDKKTAIKNGDKKTAISSNRKRMIVEYLEANGVSSSSEISSYVGLKSSRLKDYLRELIGENIIVFEGSNRNRVYKLKGR